MRDIIHAQGSNIKSSKRNIKVKEDNFEYYNDNQLNKFKRMG